MYSLFQMLYEVCTGVKKENIPVIIPYLKMDVGILLK